MSISVKGFVAAGAVAGIAAAGVAVGAIARDGSGETADATQSETFATPSQTVAAAPSKTPRTARADLKKEDLIEAVRVPGKALYTETEFEQEGEAWVSKHWYTVDGGGRSRGEAWRGDTLWSVTIELPDTYITYSFEPEELFDAGPRPPAPGAPDAAIRSVPHLAFLLEADTTQFVGETIRDGIEVAQFEIVDSDYGEERASLTLQLFVRASDLLPVAHELAFDAGVRPGNVSYEYGRVEFIDVAALPSDVFDPAPLRDAATTLTEAVVIAGQQPFETFWLGKQLDVAWADPSGNGSDHQEVVMVSAPGVPGLGFRPDGEVYVGYGPPNIPSLTLVDVMQAPSGTWEPFEAELLAAMREGGGVLELGDRSGYAYAQHMPQGTCGLIEAQTDEACRLGSVYGVVLEREGTIVHIRAAPKYDSAMTENDTNPFSSREAILGMVERLQPIP